MKHCICNDCFWKLSCSLSGLIGEEGGCEYSMDTNERCDEEEYMIENGRAAFRSEFWKYITEND